MSKNKTILVTGATGLVGSRLIDTLLRNNYNVLALSRVEQVTQHKNLSWIKFEILNDDTDKLFGNIPLIDGVIHAAAYVGHGNKVEDIEKYRKVNIKFSDLLFKYVALKELAIPIVYFSGISFLQKPLNSVITENDAVAPTSFYFLSKYWAELSLVEYSRVSKYRPVIFRISSPVSNNLKLMHNTVVRKWIEAAKSGNSISVDGDGKRSQDFVSTSDIAEAALQALRKDSASGIFNIASGTMVSMGELAAMIADFFKVKIEYNTTQSGGTDNWNISIKKAVETFGYKPRYSSADIINDLLLTIS
jgi:UDP-glucose 4-epimerase